jgi:hypothetical protein
MNSDRILVARAVFAGQLPAHCLSAEEIVEVEEELMGRIMERKALEGKLVFSVDNVPKSMYN